MIVVVLAKMMLKNAPVARVNMSSLRTINAKNVKTTA